MMIDRVPRRDQSQRATLTAEPAQNGQVAKALRAAAQQHRTGGRTSLADIEDHLADAVAADIGRGLLITQALIRGAEPC